MNFSEEELIIIAIALDEEEKEKQAAPCLRNSSRRWGVHPSLRMRKLEGKFATLYKELLDDGSKFFGYFRMSKECFNVLLLKVKDGLTKKKTTFREPISAIERLAVCLRFLATGDSFKTLSDSFRLGHSTVCEIVKSTCRTIVTALMKEVMPQPTEEMWKSIARDFETLWKFPNCIGALDGKHFTIEAPSNCGTIYYNNEHTFSIVLLALVDARYNFIMVDVGSYGQNSDGGVFARSSLGRRLEDGTLNIPSGKCLPNTTTSAPYVIVAEEGFPLKTYLMRPYPGCQSAEDVDQINFNHRLSLARRLVETSFGILTQRFRIFCRRIKLGPKNVDYVILACCILHNFLRERGDSMHLLQGNNDVTQNSQPQVSHYDHSLITPLSSHRGRASNEAFAVRDLFKNYLASTAAQNI